MSQIAKYLERYAEAEAQQLWRSRPAFQRLDCAVVLPVSGETEECFAGVRQAAAATQGTLVILVINAEASASLDHHVQNRALGQWVRREFQVEQQLSPTLSLLSADFGAVCLIERTPPRHALPAKTGVGLARKLGTDVAVALWQLGHLRSPWVFHCDADATLPSRHFTQALPARGAVSFAFRHVPCGEADVDQATLAYEVRLRYHVLGLRHAGSPYAFHSLGSALAVHAESYAVVRGFPKRRAGEDFYLLDKVQKADGVTRSYAEPLQILSRRSNRVPFGTGTAVAKQLAGVALHVDHPDCYVILRELYGSLGRVIEEHRLEPLERWHATVPSWVSSASDTLGLLSAIRVALQSTRAQDDLARRVHAWFDGLKGLRFTHALRQELPALPVELAVAHSPFVGPVPNPTDLARLAWLKEVCERLAFQESREAGDPEPGGPTEGFGQSAWR